MPNKFLFPALVIIACPATALVAQSGGFIVTLGKDTMQAESFRRTAARLDGIVVTHAPETRVMKYSLTFAADGSPLRYEMATSLPDGTPLRGDGLSGSITFAADSLTRETPKAGVMQRERIPARAGVFPAPSLPYLGVSILMYELGFAQARTRAVVNGPTPLPQVYMIPGFVTPSATSIWFVGKDSVEMDYFGVARRGFKLNASGGIIRSDWSKSTYKYQMKRVASVDAEGIAARWGATDMAGRKMGAVSPPDTMRVTIGAAIITVTYSRPSKRGRIVWGTLVPWDEVWRFGADMATHISTTADLTIGATRLPAGRYTLWMLPSKSGESQLIINKQVNIFGTNYNPVNDLVRIPLKHGATAETVEKFTLDITGGELRIQWDDAMYTVPVKSM